MSIIIECPSLPSDLRIGNGKIEQIPKKVPNPTLPTVPQSSDIIIVPLPPLMPVSNVAGDSGETGETGDEHEQILLNIMDMLEHEGLSKVTSNKAKRHVEGMEIDLEYVEEYVKCLVDNLLSKKTFNKSVQIAVKLLAQLEGNLI